MDARVKTRAERNPAGAGRQSEDARARPRRPARHLGSRARRRALRRRRAAHRAARQRCADRPGGGRRGHGADPQRKRRAREDRRLRQGRHRRPQCHGARRGHRPAHLSKDLGAWLCGREARRRRDPAQPAILRRGGRGRPQGASARRPPISTPIRSWWPRWPRPTSRQTVDVEAADDDRPDASDEPSPASTICASAGAG